MIFRTLGTPSEEEWPEVKLLPDYGKIQFIEQEPSGYEFAGLLSSAAMHLLRRFLQLNPRQRVTPTEALRAPFFVDDPEPLNPALLLDGLEREDVDSFVQVEESGLDGDNSWQKFPGRFAHLR